MKLFIDIETYCEVDIRKSGAYKYLQDDSMEVLMVAYAFDDEPIEIVDLAQQDVLPKKFIDALYNPNIEKHAHNAAFERIAFNQYLDDEIPIEQWYCTMVKTAYCGWPLSLGAVSKAMKLGDQGKDRRGKALIRYFCCPCKPTKTNGGRLRNLPCHDLDKWEEFLNYCVQDVAAEREIDNRLEGYTIPQFERDNYILDQYINDRGIKIDIPMATNAISFNTLYTDELKSQLKKITNLENPNSPAQLKAWLSERLGEEVPSLAKAAIAPLMKSTNDEQALLALGLRKELSKTSIKKYVSMLNCYCQDGRVHGLLQYYGANRTGRWAGRLVQVQNLPRNYLKLLELARQTVVNNDYDLFSMMFKSITDTLSQLIRTAFVAAEGFTFGVADFSAIEARVIAWLAGEQWRLDVFNTHGKIYEASASMMFGVPIEQITKGSDLRYRGKVAELALGYQGSVGAMMNMGAEKMGLSEPEMKTIVDKWRKANPMIVRLWRSLEQAAIAAIKDKGVLFSTNKLYFYCDEKCLRIKLPSGRSLFYIEPSLSLNRWNKVSVRYKGMDQVKKIWTDVDTYGGKLAENVVQAIARDLLAESMLALDKEGFPIVMHVHDEAICPIPLANADRSLEEMCEIMGRPIPWAEGLPLEADGYLTPFYKKD